MTALVALSSGSVDAATDDYLRCRAVDLLTMFYFHPNMTNVLKADVNNTGTSVDSFELSMNVSDDRWSGSLDLARVDDLTAGAQRAFNATLTCPAEVQEGERVKVVLTARSVLTNATDTIQWWSFVIVTHGVEVGCDEPVKEVASNAMAQFALRVTNRGETSDEFGIVCTVDAGSSGWNASPVDDRILLGVGESGSVTVDMTSPPLGTWNGTAYVTVYCVGSPSVNASQVLVCLVNATWDAALTPSASAEVLPPGALYNVTLTLSQSTNFAEGQNWSMAISTTSPAWNTTASPLTAHLVGTSTALFSLGILVPPHALAGDGARIEVTLTCAQPLARPLVAAFELTVAEVHGIDATFEYVADSPPSLEWANVTVAFHNHGNVEEAFRLVATLPVYWGIESHLGIAPGPEFDIPPWAEGTVLAAISIPENASAGEYAVALSLQSDLTASEDATIAVVVPVRMELFAVITLDGERTIVPSGGPLDFRVSLWNPGNVDETVQLLVDAAGEGCAVAPFDGTITVPRHRGAVMDLELSASQGAPYGNATASLTAHVVGTAINRSVQLEFTVVGPDLTITWAEPVRGSKEGQPVNVSVWIRNVGQGSSTATALVVQGGRQVGNTTVPPLAPYDATIVNVSLVPFAGNHTYVLEVNPGGQMREEGNATDIFELAIDAIPSNPGGSDWLESSALPIVGLVILIVVLISLAMLHARGRKRA